MSEERSLGKEIAQFDDHLDRSLDRVLSDRLLSEADHGAELTHALDLSADLSLPTTSEIDRVLESVTSAVPNDREIADVILNGGFKEITLEGMSLNALLDRGGGSIEEQSILKRGLLFLSRRKYSEAAEWWTLNRPPEVRTNPRFYTLSSLLLAFTHQLAGQTRLSEAAIAEARRAMQIYEQTRRD